eukprot:TRINITY_DN5079_c0_g3_i1.p1 TRINITY_DN5079_c0_g3~~TRINITY_DN5079_c0_g3_i1.p1  ORF type:complete len:1918 (-),score=258.91 TRINITY_DN5079_c0_g3_i1:74-5827(-)
MARDSNAFERLVDRAFADAVAEDESLGEASRAWVLLQALLVQSEPARCYAKRLLLRRVSERPDTFRGECARERLEALLELWPSGEREALADALRPAPASASASGYATPQRPRSGYSTPPLRSTDIAAFAPVLSESPLRPPPAGAAKYGPHAEVHLRPEQVTSSAVTIEPTTQSWRVSGGVVDSAATVRADGLYSRGAVGSAVCDSASTAPLRGRRVEASLDAWLRSSGSLPASQDRTVEPLDDVPRSRSLPPARAASEAIYRGDGLVLDFGPTSSSGAEDGLQNRRPDRGARPGTCGFPRGGGLPGLPVIGERRPTGGFRPKPSRSKDPNPKRRSPSVSSTDSFDSRGDAGLKSKRHLRHGGKVQFSVVVEKWRNVSMRSREVLLSQLLKEAWEVSDGFDKSRRVVFNWRDCAARIQRLQLWKVRAAMAEAASETARKNVAASAFLRMANVAWLELRKRVVLEFAQVVQGQRQALRKRKLLKRLSCVMSRCALRQAVRHWRVTRQLDAHTSLGRADGISDLRNLFVRAWTSRKTRDLSMWQDILGRCFMWVEEREGQRLAAAGEMAASLCRISNDRCKHTFKALRAFHLIQLEKESQRQQAVVRLAASLEFCLRRQVVGAFCTWPRAALQSLLIAEAARTQQASRIAARRQLRRAWGEWGQLRARLHALQRALEPAITRNQQWVLRSLNDHAVRARCGRLMEKEWAARLEAARRDQEDTAQAASLEYGIRALIAREGITVAKADAANSRRQAARMLARNPNARLCRKAWRCWVRSCLRKDACQRLAAAFVAAQRRHHWHHFRANIEQERLAFLDVQIDCFNTFVSQRSMLSFNVLQTSTSKVSELDGDSFLLYARAVLTEWCCFVRSSRLKAAKKDHGCRLMTAVLLGLVRQRALSPWRAWLASENSASLVRSRRNEVAHLRSGLIDTKRALHDAKEQVDSQRVHFEHALTVSRNRLTVAKMDIVSLDAATWAEAWQSLGSIALETRARKFVSVMRAVHAAALQSRSAVVWWHRSACETRALHFARMSSALRVVAAQQARTKGERCISSYKGDASDRRFVEVVHRAFETWRHSTLRDLVAALRCAPRLGATMRRATQTIRHVLLRGALGKLRRWSQTTRSIAADNEQHEVASRGDRSAASRALEISLQNAAHSRMCAALTRWRRWTSCCAASTVVAESLPSKANVMARALSRLVTPRVVRAWSSLSSFSDAQVRGEAFNVWKTKQLSRRLWATGTCHYQRVVYSRLRNFLQAWRGVAQGARRLATALKGPTVSRLSWSLYSLRLHAAQCETSRIQAAYIISIVERQRVFWLTQAFRRWHLRFCASERVHRVRLHALQRRQSFHLRRACFYGFQCEQQRARATQRMVVLIRRLLGMSGLRKWRSNAARRQVVQEDRTRDEAFAELSQRQSWCKKLEQHASHLMLAGLARSMLHAWRCVASTEAEAAKRAARQRQCSAKAMGAFFNALLRDRRRYALGTWRANSFAATLHASSKQSAQQRSHSADLENIRQGATLLQSIFGRCKLSVLSNVIHGPWRGAVWESEMRSIDSWSLRESRRGRADSEAVWKKMVATRNDVRHLRAQGASLAEWNDEALAETRQIMDDIATRRSEQEQALTELRTKLMQSEVLEQAAMESIREMEFARSNEAGAQRQRLRVDIARFEEQLTEARAFNAKSETERNAHSLELSTVRSELVEAQKSADELARRRMLQKRSGGERIKSLKQELQSVHKRGLEAESAIEARSRKAVLELEERAKREEETLSEECEQRSRACELHSSLAEEHERTIQHLEELLRNQGDQLRRSRESHSLDLRQINDSASFSESKSCLLQEQVSTLTQQLRREQSELKAYEKAWSCDRAALLTAISTDKGQAVTPSRRSSNHCPGRLGRCRGASPNSMRASSFGRRASLAGEGGCPCLR